MTTDQMLEKVDILRKRFDLSYREAYELLERSGGNVVKACIDAETVREVNTPEHGIVPEIIENVEERIMVMGRDLLAKVQEIVRTGQTSRIRVVKNGRTVLTIPTAVGAVGAMMFPYVTVIAAVAAMTQKYELVLDKRRKRTGKVCENPHQAGITNVHFEEKEPIGVEVMQAEITPSVSAGKVGSV